MQLSEEIRNAKTIGIGGHIRPDGDCVGSCMALYLYLKKCMPSDAEIAVYFEKPSDIFNTIKDISEIRTEAEEGKQFDLFFVLDCEGSRLGFAEKLFRQAKKKINIDHHISSNGCGDLNYVDANASSTSELVYDLLEKESRKYPLLY